jgi:hypothetical protein
LRRCGRRGVGQDSRLFLICPSLGYATRPFPSDPCLFIRILDQSTGRATRWLKFTAEEAAELREKGVRFSIYRPDEDEFRLSLPLQTI